MGAIMKRFIKGDNWTQVTLLPECLDDYVAEVNSVRVVDVFVVPRCQQDDYAALERYAAAAQQFFSGVVEPIRSSSVM